MFVQIFFQLWVKKPSQVFFLLIKNLPQKVDSQMFLSLENQMMTRFLAFTKLWCFNQIFINLWMNEWTQIKSNVQSTIVVSLSRRSCEDGSIRQRHLLTKKETSISRRWIQFDRMDVTIGSDEKVKDCEFFWKKKIEGAVQWPATHVTRHVIFFLCEANGPVAGSGGAEWSWQVRRKADLWPLESAGRAATSDRRQSQVGRHNETWIVAGLYCRTKIIKLPLAHLLWRRIYWKILKHRVWPWPSLYTWPTDFAFPPL